jgi:hypothetical protein
LVARGTIDQQSESLRHLEAAGIGADAAIVEAMVLLPDSARRLALLQALTALSRGAGHGPSRPTRPRSSEPFGDAPRPGAFPADAASFVKALR